MSKNIFILLISIAVLVGGGLSIEWCLGEWLKIAGREFHFNVWRGIGLGIGMSSVGLALGFRGGVIVISLALVIITHIAKLFV